MQQNPDPQQGQTPEPEAAATKAAGKTRRRRWPWLLAILFSTLLFVIASLAWLTASEQGFAQLWRAAERISKGQLQVGRSEGTLWHDFVLHDVRLQQGGQQTRLSRLALSWQPQALWQGRLQIAELALGDVLISGSSGEPGQPPQAPASLALPLDVQLDRFSLASLRLAADKPPLLQHLQLGYFYQQGQHALVLQQVDSPWGRLHASLALADRRPFALRGQLDYRGVLEGVATSGQLQLQQDLLQPALVGTVSALGLSAELKAGLAPFAPQALQRLRQLDVRLGGINPQALNPAWPKAELALGVQLTPKGSEQIEGGLSLINYQPGPADRAQLPLSLLFGDFHVAGERLKLGGITAKLGDGEVVLDGSLTAQKPALRLTLKQLDSQQLAAGLPSHRINGELALAGSWSLPQLDAKLKNRDLALSGRVLRRDSQSWVAEKLQLQTGAGSLLLDALWQPLSQALQLKGELKNLNPAVLAPSLPQGNINGRLNTELSLQGQSSGKLDLQLSAGTLSGAPLGGQLQTRWQGMRVQGLQADLRLGGNRLQGSGSYGQPGDVLKLLLDAPNLALLGPAFAGRIQGGLDVSGVPQRPQLKASLQARDLRLPGALAAANLQLEAESGIQQDSPFRVQLNGRDIQQGELRLAQLTLQADGLRAAHKLALQAQATAAGKPLHVQLQLQGGLQAGQLAWQGELRQLQLGGLLPLQLLQPASLQLAADRVRLGAARWQALDTQWQLEDSGWQAGQGVYSRGRVNQLALAALRPWLDIPLKQDLVFAADWAIQPGQGWPQGQLNLQRSAGDVWLPIKGEQQALGLRELRLQLGSGPQAPFNALLNSRYGQLQAEGRLGWGQGANIAATPLDGTVRLNLPDLALAQPWLNTGMNVQGRLQANLRLGGTLAAPLLDGSLSGQQLAFSERRNGIYLRDGQLQARFSGQQLLIDSLRFGKGELSGSGRIGLNAAQPEVLLLFDFRRFTLLEKPGRRLLVSGRSQIEVKEQGITLGGELTVDEGRIDLPRLGSPKLSDDVIVLGREVIDDGGNRWPLALDMTIRLGDSLRFAGNGLEAWLAGDVRLLAPRGGTLQARGQLRIERGRFKAYGQDLDISRGVVTFNGALDNPTLDVRATRRGSPVGAGVEVAGSVFNPVVRLVAEEPMSEKDRLSWLMLGRAAGPGEKDGAVAGAAAGGMLAGLINEQFGLFDDIGVGSRPASTSSSGVINPAEQVVTLGKQLTRELYVGYEFGLRSAEQALKVSYQLSRSLSLIGRAGRNSDGELRYTLRFD